MPKRFLTPVLLAVLLFGPLGLPSAVEATTSTTSVLVFKVNLEVHGKSATPKDGAIWNGVAYVPSALNLSGTTYLPLRYAASVLGEAVTYTAGTQTIDIESGTTTRPSGPAHIPAFSGTVGTVAASFHFTVNGKDETPSPAVYNNGVTNLPLSLIYAGTTYVPIRFLAGLLGTTIQYTASTKTIAFSAASVSLSLPTTSVTPTSAFQATATGSGFPAGVTVDYAWSLTWPDGTVRPVPGAGLSSQLQAALPENAPDGTYTLTVQATAGNTSASATAALTVTGSAPTNLVPKQGFVPTDIYDAYNVNPLSQAGYQGQGETITMFEAGTIDPNDLKTFDLAFGLPDAQIQTIYYSGGSNASPLDEATLDVEWAHALAPLAKITLYVVPMDLGGGAGRIGDAVAQAVQDGARIMSISYGFPEGSYPQLQTQAQSFSPAFAGYAQQGMAIFASTGDLSSYGYQSPVWPSIDPSVIAVGGTSLSKDTTTGAWKETYWSNQDGWAGAGPTDFPQATWQAAILKNGGQRAVPDVSFLADPETGVAVYYQGQWQEYGGTSVGAPCWAALWSEFDQYSVAQTGHGIKGNPTQFIYQLAQLAAVNSSTLFRSVDNVTSGSVPYDSQTGFGTPNAWNLARAIAVLGSP